MILQIKKQSILRFCFDSIRNYGWWQRDAFGFDALYSCLTINVCRFSLCFVSIYLLPQMNNNCTMNLLHTEEKKWFNGIFKEEKSFHLEEKWEWKKNLQMKQVVCVSVSTRNKQFANLTECIICNCACVQIYNLILIWYFLWWLFSSFFTLMLTTSNLKQHNYHSKLFNHFAHENIKHVTKCIIHILRNNSKQFFFFILKQENIIYWKWFRIFPFLLIIWTMEHFFNLFHFEVENRPLKQNESK